MVLLVVTLDEEQQTQLMRMVLRYYEVYSPFKGLNANEIFINSFNKLDNRVRAQLRNEMLLFVRVAIKLSWEKLLPYLSANSEYFRVLVESARKSSVIGFNQQSIEPYNPSQLAETITIPPGKTAERYF